MSKHAAMQTTIVDGAGPFYARRMEGNVQANPYEAPKAPIEVPQRVGLGVEEIASGQKLVIYAILVNLATIVGRGGADRGAARDRDPGHVRRGDHPAGTRHGLRARVEDAARRGDDHLAREFDHATSAQLPATALLRDAGYKVGLFGASK